MLAMYDGVVSNFIGDAVAALVSPWLKVEELVAVILLLLAVRTAFTRENHSIKSVLYILGCVSAIAFLPAVQGIVTGQPDFKIDNASFLKTVTSRGTYDDVDLIGGITIYNTGTRPSAVTGYSLAALINGQYVEGELHTIDGTEKRSLTYVDGKTHYLYLCGRYDLFSNTLDPVAVGGGVSGFVHYLMKVDHSKSDSIEKLVLKFHDLYGHEFKKEIPWGASSGLQSSFNIPPGTKAFDTTVEEDSKYDEKCK